MKRNTNKLNLNKRTISNLDVSQLNMRMGGEPTQGNGNTCTQCPSAYTCFLCTYGCGNGGGGQTKGHKATCDGCAYTF